LKVYTGATPEEVEKATAPNMDVKVVDQPDAGKLKADDAVRFAATLVGYDPQPFMLHWDKGKVNPEDIPSDKTPPKKKPTKPPGR
jgi:hypothetical protein